MIGDMGPWRSRLGPIGGVPVPWLAAFVTLRAFASQEDGAKWYMGRRPDGFRDRRLDDHLLAMQGLEDVDAYWEGEDDDIVQVRRDSNWRALLLATSSKGPNRISGSVELLLFLNKWWDGIIDENEVDCFTPSREKSA